MTEPIKSPFMGSETKEIRKTTDSNQIIEEGVRSFSALLRTMNESGEDTPPQVLMSFVAGWIGALKAMGFNNEDVTKMGVNMHELIVKIGTEGCGECDNCKGKM